MSVTAVSRPEQRPTARVIFEDTEVRADWEHLWQIWDTDMVGVRTTRWIHNEMQHGRRFLTVPAQTQNGPRSFAIEHIEADTEAWVNCIEVANDSGMYLAGEAEVPTHNSTMTAIKATRMAFRKPHSLVLLLSPSLRQSGELFRKVMGFANQPGSGRPGIKRSSQLSVEYSTGSRIISLPGNESTIRGYSAVDLVIVDEAAFTSDELLNAVSPMLAVSDGQLIAISSANYEMGWFYEAWAKENDWRKWKVTVEQNPRIKSSFVESERKRMSAIRFMAEYFCQFISTDAVNVFRREDIEAAVAKVNLWQPKLDLSFLLQN